METLNSLDYKARSLLILGVKRTGKTTLAARFIHLHKAPLVLVYDWQGGEFARRLGVKRARSREELLEQIDSGQRIICYDAETGEGKTECKTTGFAWWCDMVFELCGQTAGEKVIVIDEGQDLMDPWTIPPELDDILCRGGRREMNTVIIASAPNAINGTGRNQITELYCFRLVDGNARKFPVSLGLDDEEIQKLPDTECLHLDMRTGEKGRLALWSKKSKADEQPQPKETKENGKLE